MNESKQGLFSEWLEISKLFAAIFAMCFSVADVVTDDADRTKSILLRLGIYLFIVFSGIMLMVIATFWILYTGLTTYNAVNYVTEGVMMGPRWVNPPCWIVLTFWIPVPFCLYFLGFVWAIFWDQMKRKFKESFPH